MIRILALVSLSTGALLDLKMGPDAGAGSGETSLFAQLLAQSAAVTAAPVPGGSSLLVQQQQSAGNSGCLLQPGDVLIMDRLFAAYFILASCLGMGIDLVVRMHSSMKSENLDTLQRLGRGDRLVRLPRPALGDSTYRAYRDQRAELPPCIVLREITYQVRTPGFRPKTIRLLTSFLDPQLYPLEEMAELYWARWNCELDLRSIKDVMQMDRLTCKSPEMLRKEIWAHALGYNLVRTVMAQTAVVYGMRPREIRFKGTLQVFNAFRPHLSTLESPDVWRNQYRSMLRAISQQRLVSRPGRVEPRAVRSPRSRSSMLVVPRAEARRRYWKSGSAYQSHKKGLATI